MQPAYQPTVYDRVLVAQAQPNSKLVRYTQIAMLVISAIFLATGLWTAWEERNSSALLAVGVLFSVLALFADRVTRVVAKMFGQEFDITLDAVGVAHTAEQLQRIIDLSQEQLVRLTADPSLDPEARTRLERFEVQLEQLHAEAHESLEAIRQLSAQIPAPEPPPEAVRLLELPDRTATFKVPAGRQIIMRPLDNRDRKLRCVVVDAEGKQYDAVVERSSFQDNRPAFIATFPTDFQQAGRIESDGVNHVAWIRGSEQRPISEAVWRS